MAAAPRVRAVIMREAPSPGNYGRAGLKIHPSRPVLGLACLAAAVAAVAALDACAPSGVGWSSYNGDLQSDRFSSLAAITPQNVADLREVCEAALGDDGAFQPGPLVIGDTIYLTTSHTTAAVGATDCSIRWQYQYSVQGNEPLPVNRGVAYLDGRLFRGTGDGWLLALDAKTGKELWRVQAADPKIAEYFSAAPIAWNGLVFLGPSGGDWGIQGRVAGFDAATGKEVWRFHTVPGPGEAGYETWQIPASAKRGGGGTWTSYTLDPATGELFVPVGNPAPAFRPDVRPGDDLYTDALVVLDARTGALKWYYQLDRNDAYDLDLGAAPALYTDAAGKRRVAVGSKDGYLYILDRDTHQLAAKTAITTVRRDAPVPSPEGTYACPGYDGGIEWNGPAYSASTNDIYVGSVDWCGIFSAGPVVYDPPKIYFGTASKFKPGDSKTGWVYAVNGSTGQVAWRYHAETPVLSGATPTAGGVLLSGESSGELLAFDAASGALLAKQNLGGSMGGGVITYAVGGKQYVATTAGNLSRSGLSAPGNNTPRLIVMTTGLPAAYQPVKVEAAPRVDATGARGEAIYNQFCVSCHGEKGAGGAGPSLRGIATRKSGDEIMNWIKNPAPPMPKLYPQPLSDTDVERVTDYLEHLG